MTTTQSNAVFTDSGPLEGLQVKVNRQIFHRNLADWTQSLMHGDKYDKKPANIMAINTLQLI